MNPEKTVAYLRWVLAEECRERADFDKFMIDHFFATYQKLADSQNRVERENYLFLYNNIDEIYEAVIKTWGHVKQRFLPINNDQPTPMDLGLYNDIVDCLLNRYSLVLGDGDGPEEYLLPYSGPPGEHAKSNKAAFMYWEGIQHPDAVSKNYSNQDKRDLLIPFKRSNYPKHLIAKIEPNRIDIKSIVEKKLEFDRLLKLVVELLPPGLHISFSVLPWLEYQLLAVRPDAKIYSVMPRIALNHDPSQPGAIIKTYTRNGTDSSRPVVHEGMREFIIGARCDVNNATDYHIIRPCGGFSLDCGHSEFSQMKVKLETECVAVTDDHYKNISEYGLFGRKNDSEILKKLSDERRRILYADFEMDYAVTRSMLDWILRSQNHRENDMVLNQNGLYRYEGNGREPVCRSINFTSDDIGHIREHINRHRPRSWWMRGC